MDDFDFAPELDELLRDPMLGDASGFERFLCNQGAEEAREAAPTTSASAPTPAASVGRLSSPADNASSASAQTPVQQNEEAREPAQLSTSLPCELLNLSAERLSLFYIATLAWLLCNGNNANLHS